MRIAIICRFLPPAINAVGEYASHLARALCRKGMRVSLVTSTGRTSEPTEAMGPVEIHRVVSSWGWAGMSRLAHFLRSQRFDVVHFQFVPQMYGRWGIALPAACLPLLLRARAGPQVLTTCHELLSYRPAGLRNLFLQRLYLLQAFLLLRGSARLIVPTEWQERLACESFPRYAAKITRIPVGANVLPLGQEGSALTGSARKPATDPLRLGTFGTGHPWWRYEDALIVLKGLRDEGLPVHLVCIGDIAGTHPTRYQKLRNLERQLGLTGAVQWTGPIPAHEVSRLLRSVDVFLALQDRGITARSTALMAAFAHGLPIVATDGPLADRWLTDSGALEVVEPGNPASAQAAISSLARNPERRRELADRSRSFYDKNLSWEALSARILEVTRSLTSP